MIEDEMVGWQHRLNRHESEQKKKQMGKDFKRCDRVPGWYSRGRGGGKNAEYLK